MRSGTAKRERHRRIVAELRANPTVRISELADEFRVSTETVRRDIDELSEQGLVNRTYGGAAATSMSREPTIAERGGSMVAERERIARRTVELIQPGDVLMIDAGATVAHFARRLAVESLEVTVITNSLSAAAAFTENEAARVIICPGEFDGHEQGVFGPDTLAFLRRFHANRAMFSTTGITAEGLSDVHSQACWVKRELLERADNATLLIDHGKFEQRLLEVVASLDRLDDLVTDQQPPPDLSQALERAGVTLHLA